MRRKEIKRVPAEETVVQLVPEETVEEGPVQCNAPAPLVANGVTYVGCQQEQGHEGHHEVVITWPR